MLSSPYGALVCSTTRVHNFNSLKVISSSLMHSQLGPWHRPIACLKECQWIHKHATNNLLKYFVHQRVNKWRIWGSVSDAKRNVLFCVLLYWFVMFLCVWMNVFMFGCQSSENPSQPVHMHHILSHCIIGIVLCRFDWSSWIYWCHWFHRLYWRARNPRHCGWHGRHWTVRTAGSSWDSRRYGTYRCGWPARTAGPAWSYWSPGSVGIPGWTRISGLHWQHWCVRLPFSYLYLLY